MVIPARVATAVRKAAVSAWSEGPAAVIAVIAVTMLHLDTLARPVRFVRHRVPGHGKQWPKYSRLERRAGYLKGVMQQSGLWRSTRESGGGLTLHASPQPVGSAALRRTLVTAEVALSVTLLVGAVIFGTAALASLLPAQPAVGIDPAVVLKAEQDVAAIGSVA